jgi:hypothetical protein
MPRKDKKITDVKWQSVLLNYGRQSIIKRFLERAKTGNHPFDAFIDAWVAFNAIGSNATWFASDVKVVAAFKSDRRCKQTFASLMANDTHFANAVSEFRSMWPISSERDAYKAFKAADALKASAIPSEAEVMAFCRSGGIKGVPLDDAATWANVLSALYQVRCNLFHGGKNPINPRDRELTAVGHAILTTFIHALNLF